MPNRRGNTRRPAPASLRVVRVVLFIVLALAAACAQKPSANQAKSSANVPYGSLVAETFAFQLAIYHLEKPNQNVADIARSFLQNKPLALRSTPAEKVAGPSVAVGSPEIASYAPPSPDLLEYFARGLSDAEKAALSGAREVTVLDFAGPGEAAPATYRLGLELVAEVVSKVRGFPWDEETREAFTVDEWQKRLRGWEEGRPDIARHITIHAYRHGELIRLVTLGMKKFALPDLAATDVSSSDSLALGNVVNLACQTMLERQRLDQPGKLDVSIDGVRHGDARARYSTNVLPSAERRATLELFLSRPEQGDADNRLLELGFSGPGGLQERHAELIARIFGASDSITMVEHDEELLAASERARQKVLSFRDRYRAGVPEGEQLLVKAPFKTPEGENEWMWVEVVSWQGNVISGILQNQPFNVPALKSGARVDVRADEIFDYTLTRRDGSREGNETGRIMERRQQRQ
jgi:uncharacterized protein YegJ (DUF2314 family)